MFKVFRRITTIDDARQALRLLTGYVGTTLIPRGASHSVLDWIDRKNEVRVRRRIRKGSERIVPRVKTVLGDRYTDESIGDIVAEYYRIKLEDQWARGWASHWPDWPVKTEVVNLHHLEEAQRQGQGVVLWGMPFCGVLFPKIALSRAGVCLTQLSLFDHGKSFHNTLIGNRVRQPLYWLPENQFLNERIVIPESGPRSYLFRIGAVLKDKGCIWIAGLGAPDQRNLTIKMLGRQASLPAGAPTIALRNNAALIPTHTRRLGKLHYQVVLSEPIDLDVGDNRRAAVQRIVQNYADMFEAQLLEQPGAWGWSHDPVACGLVQN